MPTANIHASCVVLERAGIPLGAPENAGVLITGPSGSGKSDLALRLIERGAMLVADDRVDVFVREDSLWACCPPALTGLLEIRGIGVVSLPSRREASIVLAVQLTTNHDIQRFPETEYFTLPTELTASCTKPVPLIRLLSFESSAPAKAIAATAAFAHALFRDGRKP